MTILRRIAAAPAEFVLLVFSTLLFVGLSPLFLLNEATYRRALKKNPFGKSWVVRKSETCPRFFDLVTLLFNFPIGKRIYGNIPRLYGRVLQVGCGTGTLNRFLKGDTPRHLVNIDINEQLLRFGAERKRLVKAVAADIYQTPFRAGSFDQIVFSRCFHHIRNHRKALVECERLLADNGRIFITDPISLSSAHGSTYPTNTAIDGVIWRFSKQTFAGYMTGRLPRRLTLHALSFLRQKCITNYNFLYPHTDCLAILEKAGNDGTHGAYLRKERHE